MNFIDYEPRYKDAIFELEAKQWGAGSDSDDIMQNLDKYNIKLIENNGGGICGCAIWHVQDDKVCFIDMVLLAPEIQHQGYGSKLMKIIIDFAIAEKCQTVECEAIDCLGKTNIENLLNKFNFVEKYKVENYWGKSCPDFHCKECGQCPCVCSMRKFVKVL